MKTLLNQMRKIQHAIHGNIAMGGVTVGAGLIQANVALMYAGAFLIFLSAALLILIRVVNGPVVEGVVVGLHPQLTAANRHETDDVQLHMQRTRELTQAS